eukprot:TRINITY_DN940_c0_g1_i2.p1 TRINITY_DN940_c0_g1~~TRINITY_DN940_c0_g1_i2.p1  ORF type:complete len:1041 (+),score=370.45 TRINITY_DN940_c0_g1_i2:396-3125(+)
MEVTIRPNIFEDDLVCIGDNRTRVGEVIRLGWQKHDDEQEHDHDEGEECEEDDLGENLVLVGWTTGELTKEDPKNLTVLERYVSLGDNVQRIPKEKDEPLMLGSVTSISMFLDIETKNNGILKNVHCENVKHIHPFQKDEFVISKKGKWIGRIFNTLCDVTILFEDGAACIIPEADNSVLKVIGGNQNKQDDEQGDEMSNMTYCPGDVVRANKAVLKEAQWISGKNNNKRGMATVVEVKPTMVFVDWFTNGSWDDKDEFPPGECGPKDITVIDPFEKFNWGIGDVTYLRKGLIEGKDLDQVQKSEFEGTPMATLKAKNNNKGASIKTFITNSTGKVNSLCTFINVLWQDGTVSEKISSTSVYPVYETSEKDFFPNEYVNSIDTNDFGVVQRVNVKDSTCDIKWHPERVETGVSLFSIREHAFNQFRLASCVIKLPGQDKTPKNWVGFIIGASEFKVQIKWNSGEITDEDPNTLMILPMTDDDDDELMDGEGFEGEDEDEEKGDTHNQSDFVFSFGESKVLKPTKLESFNQALEETEKLVIVLFGETWNMQCAQMMNSLDTFSVQFPDVTFVYVNVEEFKPAEANDSTTYPSFRVIHKKKVLSTFESSDENQLKGEIERWSQTVGKPTTTTTNTNTETSTGEISSVGSSTNNLEQFLILQGTPTKHAFSFQHPEVVSAKTVLKDFECFSKFLPSGTYVRVFESRLDIFRVLVFGPENTPFAFTPFIFDVQVPSQYPKVPPNIFYNSLVSEKLHPNIFVNGKVCSSLIGTHEEGKLWDGNKSNLLEVMVELNDILTDSEPYYSEPDFDELKGTQKGIYSSRIFSESSLLLSLRNIIAFLKNNTNLSEFKSIVENHLKENRSLILDNLKKFLDNGVTVSKNIYSVPFEGTSVGFKKVLGQILEELSSLLGKL